MAGISWIFDQLDQQLIKSTKALRGYVMTTKTEKQKFKNDAFAAIHSATSALRKIGAIDKPTMRSFDDSCIAVPQTFGPQQMKKIRERN